MNSDNGLTEVLCNSIIPRGRRLALCLHLGDCAPVSSLQVTKGSILRQAFTFEHPTAPNASLIDSTTLVSCWTSSGQQAFTKCMFSERQPKPRTISGDSTGQQAFRISLMQVLGRMETVSLGIWSVEPRDGLPLIWR